MSELAAWMARKVWAYIVLFMRLPWVRRFRRTWMRCIPEGTRRRMIAQDRFARRHGVAVLRFSLTLMLASLAITGSYYAALALFHSGVIGQIRE